MKVFSIVILMMFITGCGEDFVREEQSSKKRGVQLLPDVDCHGSMNITATGELKASIGPSIGVEGQGHLNVDCEEFHIHHIQLDDNDNR